MNEAQVRIAANLRSRNREHRHEMVPRPRCSNKLDLNVTQPPAEGKALGVGQLDFVTLGQRAGGNLPRRGQQVAAPVTLVAFAIGGMQRHVNGAAVLLPAAGEPDRPSCRRSASHSSSGRATATPGRWGVLTLRFLRRRSTARPGFIRRCLLGGRARCEERRCAACNRAIFFFFFFWFCSWFRSYCWRRKFCWRIGS